jgi:hypothetical protein
MTPKHRRPDADRATVGEIGRVPPADKTNFICLDHGPQLIALVLGVEFPTFSNILA